MRGIFFHSHPLAELPIAKLSEILKSPKVSAYSAVYLKLRQCDDLSVAVGTGEELKLGGANEL